MGFDFLFDLLVAMVLGFVVGNVVFWYSVHCLLGALRSRCPEKWVEVTTMAGNIGPGWWNGMKFWSFVNSDEDYGDPRVREYKRLIRKTFVILSLMTPAMAFLIVWFALTSGWRGR